MELVEHDQGLGSISFLEGGIAKRFPHVHDRKADFAGFLGAKPGKELVHAGFGSIFAAEPNGPAAVQVADNDTVTVASADGNLVDANGRGRRRTGAAELFAHVLFVQLLDGVSIQEQFFGHGFDRAVPAASSHEEGEPLGEKRIVGQPIQAFGFHADTPRARNSANEEIEIDAFVATGKISNPTRSLIVERRRHLPTDAARRFF
jgi:hypothetical protein